MIMFTDVFHHTRKMQRYFRFQNDDKIDDSKRSPRSFNNPRKSVKDRVDLSKQKQCMSCHKRFALQIQLNKHLEKHHSNEGYRCMKCNKVFHGKNRYANHATYFHPDPHFIHPKRFQCKNCKARFNRESSLKNHYFLCYKNKVFCNQCNQTFTNLIEMRTHVFHKHLNLRFTDPRCKWCDMPFDPNYMTYHILANHTDSTAPVLADSD